MISVCLPIHNEERYLKYSLPALMRCQIDELIVLFDRCTDNSELLTMRMLKHNPPKLRVLHKMDQAWHCPTAEVFERLFSEAEGDIIYAMAADIVPDPKMFDESHFINADIMSYLYLNHDLENHRFHQQYINFLKKYVNVAKSWRGELAWKSGLFGCTKQVYVNTHFHDVPSEYDDFLERALAQGYRYRFNRETRNLHLRVGLSKSRQYLQGMSRAQRRVHPLMVLGHSIMCLKPYVWTSYLQERRYGLYKSRKWGKEGYE